MASTTLPTHPRTGLRAIGYRRNGAPIWPILGGSEPVGEPAPTEPVAPSAGDQFPANTPVAEMTTEQAANYWKHQARKHEDRVKAYGGLSPEQIADLRERAEQFDALADSVKTDTERAVEEAREAAWQSAMAHAVPRVVSAEFKAEAARLGIGGEQLDAVLEDLDLYKYATDDGDPDVERIGKKLAAFAPAQPQRRTGPSPSGLGNRGGDVNPTPKDIASSFLAKRFPSTAAKAR